MKQASRNYFVGTIVKTPIKAYLAGSSLHVAIQEFILVLELFLYSSGFQNVEFMTVMIERAVMIYIPATDPATFFLNCLLGIVAVAIWTIRYDQATNF